MKVHYDKEHDILYLAFKDGPSHEIIESARNVILELDEKKEIMGLRSEMPRRQASLSRLPRSLQAPSLLFPHNSLVF